MKQNNIIVIPAFCDTELPYYVKKCIKFWRYWCSKHDIELY